MPTIPKQGSGPAIVAWAEAQEGKPYVWGGVGPNGFDCSGLTSQAYLHGGGITIPRVAAAQQTAGTRITAAELQPADLCFEGIPAFHVVMFVGGGEIVAADETGTNVRTRSFDPSEFTGGFRRMANLNESGGGSTTNLLSDIIDNTPLGGIAAAAEGVNAVAGHLLSATWWERIGKMALALVIIGIGLVIMNRKRIEQAGATALKAAEVVK
jgi:hypothetical protein